MRLVSLCAVLVVATPAIAQDGSTPVAQPEKKICRSFATTGSILGGKRECHTKAEWAAISERSRNDREAKEREGRVRSGSIGE
jgi:hypothetical protein